MVRFTLLPSPSDSLQAHFLSETGILGKTRIGLSEGEEDARTQALAALAIANGDELEPRRHFTVKVVVRRQEVYQVAAATAEEVEDDYWAGQLIRTDDLDTEVRSVVEERTGSPGLGSEIVAQDGQEQRVGAESVSFPLPPDPEGRNDARASWAARAVGTFKEATGTDDGDALCDLLTDLMHWADRINYGFEAAHHVGMNTGRLDRQQASIPT